MSWLGWGSYTTPQYEELVEKYCSPNNLSFPQSEDIATALEITDLIRSKAVQPKPAMQTLKRRVASKNGRVQMYGLSLIDTCIKNGGDHFLAEIASKEFVDEMAALIRSSVTNAEVKQLALKLFQQWALAFESKRELAFLPDVYKELKNTGMQFPPPPAHTSSHLIATVTAPTWVDSDVCMRCRTAFTFTNRKHHCRNCGLVYDQQCSSNSMPLPHFGITDPVRVCDTCWTKAGKNKPAGPAPAVPGRTPRSRQDLDADLQRAIELSLADAQPSSRNHLGSEPPLRRNANAQDDDEELRLAIEASLREMESRPSAPVGAEEPEYKPLPTFDLNPRETETILTFSNTLDQMAAYGERDLRRFPYAHVLYEQAYALGGKLHRNVEEKHTKQQMLAEMQDKLSQAVGLYGQILDGQQAYSARKLQEQQQRQYHQQMYGNYAPQQYNPYAPPQAQDNRYASPAPQMNGHAQQYSQYLPQQYQPPVASQAQRAPAGPSLYPSMPSQIPQYIPQTYQAPQHQQHQQPTQGYAPPPQADGTYDQQSSQYHQTALAASQSPVERQQPVRSFSGALPPQAAASGMYGADHPSIAAVPVQGYAVGPSEPTAAGPSAPPPVDLASHPASSPRSIKSNLASAPAQGPESYTSPAAPAASLPHTSYQQAQPQPQSQVSAPTWQSQAPQHQQQQHLYSTNSFPQAPAAVFPDAPSEEFAPPSGIEKQEQKEALLIEL